MSGDPFDPSFHALDPMAAGPGPHRDADTMDGEADALIDAELAAMLEELTASPELGAGPPEAAMIAEVEPQALAADTHVVEDAGLTEDPDPADVPSARFLVCTVGGTRCALPIANIAEVGRVPTAMPLPFVPAWVTGVINLRGQIVSLVDLAALLIGGAAPAPTRMVVVQRRAGGLFGALLVDAVHGTRDVPLANLSTVEGAWGGGFGGFVSAAWRTGDDSHPGGGDTGLAVPVLDLERLITSEHVQVSTSA